MKAAALLLPLLAGCASDLSGYPSLSVRPEERVSMAATVPDLATGSPSAGADLRSRLAGLEREAATARTGFDRQAGPMDRAVAAATGAAVDSEAWTFAQQAISRAEAELVASAAVLAEADRLLTDLRLTAAAEPDTGGLDEATATRTAIASAHQQRVERLEAARARLR